MSRTVLWAAQQHQEKNAKVVLTHLSQCLVTLHHCICSYDCVILMDFYWSKDLDASYLVFLQLSRATLSAASSSSSSLNTCQVSLTSPTPLCSTFRPVSASRKFFSATAATRQWNNHCVRSSWQHCGVRHCSSQSSRVESPVLSNIPAFSATSPAVRFLLLGLILKVMEGPTTLQETHNSTYTHQLHTRAVLEHCLNMLLHTVTALISELQLLHTSEFQHRKASGITQNIWHS